MFDAVEGLAAEHTQRGVPAANQLSRRVNNSLEKVIKLKLAGDFDRCFVQGKKLLDTLEAIIDWSQGGKA